jgi:two-component system OmpR family response regulator
MSPHILIVDDDEEMRGLLLHLLTQEGFHASAAADGEAMRGALAGGGVDLVVLDRMLPGEDGLSLCRALRRTTALPVIMLTAMGSEADRVAGLDTGADDYLAKPFGARELLARIRAVLRRAGSTAEAVYRFAGWSLDTVQRVLRAPDGVLVDITGGEFELLLAFLRHPHQVLSRDQLLDLARGRVSGPEDRTIDVQVGRLRRKLETDAKNPDLLKTVRGGGYVLAADVQRS